MDRIIGIDLGTSTSEAAVYEDGQVRMLKNFLGEAVTPSAVGIDESGNWVCGERARSQLLLSPENTAIEIKRRIGSEEKIMLGGREYSPVDLSARILEYVKTYASKELGEEISRVVISVPAYFNDIQRKETILAGELAGLRVERIINEPTAAAMSYGLEHMDEESHILVYDLGGGTFDVTLLEMFDGVLEVKASSGDNQLGGKDFDEKLCAYLASEFQRMYSVNPKKDLAAMVRLKDEAERCKKALSTQESYRVLLPVFMQQGGRPLDLDITVTAEKFAELTKELVERAHAPIDVVLQDCGVLPNEIDKVILVGGSTRMPMIARDIESYLGLVPDVAVNPDFAVAEGAAIQAAIIAGEIGPEEGLIMTDVNPFSLGVRCFDGYTSDRMSVVIPRNVTIPTSRKQIYDTTVDYQDRADIDVYQGESQYASSNQFLGTFRLGGIPARPQGEERLEVTFSYDANGLLQVEAKVLSTGKKASIEIDLLNQKPIERGDFGQAKKDVSGWKNVKLAAGYKTLIRKAERELKKLKIDDDLLLAEELEDFLFRLKAAILDDDRNAADEMREEIEDFLYDMEE